MQAIILGAGRGSRLGALNPGVPKPLLQVLGCTLLERQVGLLTRALPELEAISFVAGYRADLVRAISHAGIRVCENTEWETTNTAASLHVAFELDNQEAILLNGDVFFDSVALSRVLHSTDTAVCEFKSNVDAEEVQVIVDGMGRIQRIGKDIGGVAEAVGIYRMSERLIGAFMEAYAPDDRNRYYEDVFNRVILERRACMDAVRLAEGVAIEIDTPADLARVTAIGAGV